MPSVGFNSSVLVVRVAVDGLAVKMPHVFIAHAVGVRISRENIRGDIVGQAPSDRFLAAACDGKLDGGKIATVVAISRIDQN